LTDWQLVTVIMTSSTMIDKPEATNSCAFN